MAVSFIPRALEKIAPFVGKYHRQSQLNLLEHIYSPLFVIGTVADLQKKTLRNKLVQLTKSITKLTQQTVI